MWELGFGSFANVVDEAIGTLRKALDNKFDLQLIHTVRGVGYKVRLAPVSPVLAMPQSRLQSACEPLLPQRLDVHSYSMPVGAQRGRA